MDNLRLLRDMERRQLLGEKQRRGTLPRQGNFVPQGDPTLRDFGEGVANAAFSAVDSATFGALPYLSSGLTGADVEDMVNFRNSINESTGGKLGSTAMDFGLGGALAAAARGTAKKTAEGFKRLTRQDEKDVVAYLNARKTGELTPAAQRGYEKFHSLDQRPIDMLQGLPPKMADDMLGYLQHNAPSSPQDFKRRLAAGQARITDREQVKILEEYVRAQAEAKSAASRFKAGTQRRAPPPRGPDDGDWEDWVRRNTGPDKPNFDPRLLDSGYVPPGSSQLPVNYTGPDTMAALQRAEGSAVNPQIQSLMAQLRESARFRGELADEKASVMLDDLTDKVLGDRIMQQEGMSALRRFRTLGAEGGSVFSKMPPEKARILEQRAHDAMAAQTLLNFLETPQAALGNLGMMYNPDRVIMAMLGGFKHPRNIKAFKRFVEDQE